MRPLIKTTIVIWSEPDYGTDNLEIDELAREAMVGDAYCSSQVSQLVEDPDQDPMWDGTEFFDDCV